METKLEMLYPAVFRVQGSGFWERSLVIRALDEFGGLGFRVQGLGFRA